ncbi:30S ribosomal protein S9, partial [Candidatus Woesearchaeota archaeon]|nr:30S ribosomal protein S9 [Candidatus Woesearchaeota archaeon]
FPGVVLEKMYLGPFKVTNTMDRFAVTAKVEGSGLFSQLGEMTHAISRVLLEIDKENFRGFLRKEGYLTRDSREKERRKAGLAGKARAGKQSPKR